MAKFNDLHSNYGLPEGVAPEQIVNGAIIRVQWTDVPIDDCLVIDASEFQEYCQEIKNNTRDEELICIDVLSIDSMESRTITQDQIVKLVATHNTVRDALKVWSNPDVE